jgi:plasmid stabilization system protein ParE
LTFTFRAEAADDIGGARAWYEEQRTGLGEDFVDSLEHALDLVQRLPRSFPLVAPEVHRALLRRFPYALYFRLVGSEKIEIIACLHTRRSPHILRSRRSDKA